MMPAIYGNSYQIVQGPDYVAIVYEMIHETRVIPLDGRPHVGRAIRSYMGDARGRWEGDTLVVETTNFKDQIAYRNANRDDAEAGRALHADRPDTVEWSVTVDDPATWTRPWTFAMNLTKKDAEPAAVRVRLPRRQLRLAEHPERRARRGTSAHRDTGQFTQVALSRVNVTRRSPCAESSCRFSSRWRSFILPLFAPHSPRATATSPASSRTRPARCCPA